MSEINLDEIFLNNDNDNIDIDTPIQTTDEKPPEVVPEVVETKKKRGRRAGTISEEQRQKMLDNLKRGREKKKRELLKKKNEKLEAEDLTLKAITELKNEIALLKNSQNKPLEKKQEIIEKQPEKQPEKQAKPEVIEKQPEKEPEIKDEVYIMKNVEPPKQPKVVYHGYNPNKRRY